MSELDTEARSAGNAAITALRIRKKRQLPAKKRVEMEGLSLTIHPGERVHEALVLDLGGAGTLKVLAKERMEDGRISILLKHQEPSGKVRVVRPRTWLSRAEYDEVFGPLRDCPGKCRPSVIPGAEIEAGVSRVAEKWRRKGCSRRGGAEGSPARPGPVRTGQGGGVPPWPYSMSIRNSQIPACAASLPLPLRASPRVLRRHHLLHGGVDNSRVAAGDPFGFRLRRNRG
jgi:hypothetical protein